MQSSHVVLYVLLLGVIGALILSFIQLYQPRDVFRAFVPHYFALHYRQFAQYQKQHSLDFLAYLLCKNFHVMSVFPSISENDVDDDVLFRTLVPQQAISVTLGLQNLELLPGDLLAYPITAVPLIQPPDARVWSMKWRIHPFPRAYKVSKCETEYICQEWRKKKLRLNVWPVVNRLTRKEVPSHK